MIATTDLDEGADVTVVGSDGRDEATELLIDSVGERVVHIASCRVIVVKPGLLRPALPTSLPPSVHVARSAARNDSRGRGLVLIADDTFDTRELYEVYLSARGFTVRTVVDGAAALDAAVIALPDVIVMDLSMPRLDGVTATRQLKQNPRTKRIPVIIWTAYPHRAVQQGALEAGADTFLMKPCLPEELEAHVSRLIAGAAPSLSGTSGDAG